MEKGSWIGLGLPKANKSLEERGFLEKLCEWSIDKGGAGNLFTAPLIAW